MKAIPLAGRNITYSPSFTLPVTRACANRCVYCGFRRDDDELMDLGEIDQWLGRAQKACAAELLILSGERVDEIPSIQDQLLGMGFTRFADYVAAVCRRALAQGFLPHTNFGILEWPEMALLRECNASMGLMLENADPSFGQRVHPQKDIAKRMSTIENAGRLKIPFTTGILIGLGEPPASRLASLQWIAGVHAQYRHIQEVILQNYVPNRGSALPAWPLSLDDWNELIFFCKEKMPDVQVQIPPNLNPSWPDLIFAGGDDLGGISPEDDFVNPESPWQGISRYRSELESAGKFLIPRLPIYKTFYQKGWVSPAVKEPLEMWVNRDEFQYYRQ
jgi:7,8-didemethyl-8-hydroxy-5-deazariboflavin synthase CofG subunit